MDIVREYLKKQGYADHVVRDGIGGLVRGWEAIAASVAAGEEQCQDAYLNDMDGRQILEDALAAAPPAERSIWIDRVAAADRRIRDYLVPTQNCIWGDENAAKYGYDRERDWWYGLRPPVVEPEWHDR